jgi:hypothetical protein
MKQLFLKAHTKKYLTQFALIFSAVVTFAGCGGGGGSDFAGLSANNGITKAPCKVSEHSPSSSTLKVSSSASSVSNFNITPTSSTCKTFFYINDVKYNAVSANFIELASTALTSGVNKLRVETANDLGSDSFEWTISKNTPPTCNRAAPTTNTLNMSSTASQAFTVNATAEPGETLAFTWAMDSTTNPGLVEVISSSTASQAMLTANSGMIGVRTITATVSDGYDTTVCSWSANVGQDCSLTAKSPNVANLRMAAASGSSSSFSVTATNPTCLVSWTLNGLDLAGSTTSRAVQSNELNTGSNLLKAEVTSSSGSTSQTWTVVKNTPPSCSQSPAASGNSASVSLPIALTANITDTNSDPVTWSWKQNGSAVSQPPVSVSNGTNTTTATFTPAAGHIGYNSFDLRMDDGYDSATCSWTVQVNPLCTLTSTNPTGTSLTIPNLGTNLNTFSVFPSDSSCAVTWTMNGISLGTSAVLVNLFSSSFGTTSTLTATAANPSSTTSHTWNITKNSPPVCASQVPANSGSNLAVSSTQAFVANMSDANSGQSLSYSWKLNGNVPSATYFTSTDSAASSTGTWTALNSQVGSNTLSVNVSDGYDPVTCTWPVDVLRNCTVSSATPSGTNLRVPFAPTTATSFGVVPNDASCSIVWKLNGTAVSTDVNFQNFLSSALNSGAANTVSATLTNAVGSTTRNWSVAKNSKPVCSAQSPGATGNSINVGGSQVFSGTAIDADSDGLTFAWTLGGQTSNAFSSISNSLTSSTATLTPGLGQVGNGQTIALTMNDGYDSSMCSWTADVVDPNSAQILSWTPSVSPVVILSTSDKTFTVSATGTGLSYAWFLDSVVQSGKTTSAATFSNTDMSIGAHSIKVVVTDTYNNTAEKIFSVIRNAPPSLSSYSPNVTGVTTYKINFNSTLAFAVSAADANSDALTYNWSIDGASNAVLIPGSPGQATLSPGGNSLFLGPHTVRVAVSDGNETFTQSWYVMVNMFSTDCNDLYNSNPLGTNGGRTCTLVGNPSMGHGQDILTDQTLLKAKPYAVIELETNVFAFSDHLNNAVVVYNANSSGPSKSYFGQTIAPRTAKVVVGNGAPGRNSDASSPAPAFQTVGTLPTQVSVPVFKLNEPRGLAYDALRNILYIADRLNHRVIALNSAGQAYRVLGSSGGATSQNATTNSLTESYGFNQVCSEPIGIAISGRYLYVGCWTQHAIKRVNIDDPTNSASYSLTKTVVGRQNASSANSVSPIVSVSPDGYSDANNSPTTGGVVYANNVIDVAADSAGIVYWLERGGTNQGLRLRALNTGNSAVNFFGTYPNSDHTSLPGAFNFHAFDTTGLTLTSGSFQANIVNATAGTLAGVGIQTGGNLGQNACHMVNTRLIDGASNSIILGVPTVVSMAVTAGTGSFFSDPDCLSALPSSQFTIPAGASQGSVFVKMTAVIGTYGIRSTAGAFNSIATGAVVAMTTTATSIRVTAPPRFRPDECVLVELGLVNSTTPAILAAGRVVSPTTNNYGTFYSDPSCTVQIDRLSISSSKTNQVAYFKRNVAIPPGWVGSLAGYNNAAAASYAQYSDVKIGQMRFEDGQTGLDILKNTGTGLPDGIFYSNQTQHYLSFINFKTTDPGLGVPISSQSSSIVFGLGNAVTPSDISGGYNGEDQPAWGTRLNQPVGVRLNLAQTKVLFGDYVNLRGRVYEIDSAGYARTNIGAGRSRDRIGVTVSDPTQLALVNPYKLELSNGYLYFSEYGNNRIRRTNLSSGSTDVVAGNGSSGTPTEGNDAIADNMTNPRGFKVVPFPTSSAPTNFVLIYAETCQIRAVNLSGPTISNFFGVGNLLPGKVKTVAGDTSFGCGTWSSLPNTDGMAATSARLNVPEDIAYIDGEIYVVNSSDQCLVKITSAGTIERPQGPSSCSTTVPTSNDATMTNMRTRYPKSFAPDVAKPGNYFFIDQYSDTTGFIRYINSLTAGITFKSSAPINVPARTTSSSPMPVATVYQYSATSGASGVGGVASWVQTSGASGTNDKVCWTAGVLSNGANGAHAVYCANRNQDDDGTLAAGPSGGSTIRAGAPLDREQEQISRLNATFYSPYGIAFDDDGNLYISEYNNHIIRMIRRWW